MDIKGFIPHAIGEKGAESPDVANYYSGFLFDIGCAKRALLVAIVGARNPYKLPVCFEKRPFKIQMRRRLMSD